MYNAVVAKRKNFTFRLDPDIVSAVARFAEGERRSLNNMVETTLYNFLHDKGIEVQQTPDDSPASD